MKLTRETVAKTLKAWNLNGRNNTATGEALGISETAVRRHIRRAAELGLFAREEWSGGAVPPGYQVAGVSTLTGADGAIKGQWYKATREREGRMAMQEALESWVADLGIRPARPTKRGSHAVSDDLLTVYPLADFHLGMHAWGKETGEDYDIKIAGTLLREALTDLVLSAPASKTAVVLNLGDFFHSDDDSKRTRRSGAELDVDTRYARVLKLGIDLTIWAVDTALEVHESVIYRALPGNHDPYAALALALAVAKYFEKEPRVTVDLDPSRFWVFQFGSVMLAATHGDTIKPDDFPGFAAARWPKIWGATTTGKRFAFFGHVHHRSRGGGEKHGMIWETFQTLAPKDAWHAAAGYVSGRSMSALVYHKDKGEMLRITRSVDYQ